MEEELKFAKSSADEPKKVQEELKSLEEAGQTHDDDLTALLEPIVQIYQVKLPETISMIYSCE